MTRIWKREQRIRNNIAVKKMNIIKEQIKSWELVVNKPIYWMIPKYENPQEMESIIKGYIDEKLEKSEPFTIAWLCKVLQIDVETLRNYSKKDEFLGVIKKLKIQLLESYEKKMLNDPKSFNALKYYLENNFSQIYSSKTTQDITITWNVSLSKLADLAEARLQGNVIEWELA